MSKANVLFSYTGKALEENSMEIIELARALTGIGEVFQEANAILNKDKAVTTVQVNCFQEGSFGIEFEVIQQGINISSLFNSDPINGALNLIEILGLSIAVGSAGSVGLFQFIKFLKGKAPKEIINKNSEKEIINYNGEKIVITNNVYNLYKSQKVRIGFEKTVQPLSCEGIDGLEIKNKKNKNYQIIESITEKEKDYFIFSEQSEKINEYENTMFLNLMYPSFENGKWKFSVGSDKFFATITDEKFMDEVNNGTRLFGKKDIIKAVVLVKQIETGNMQIKNDYELKKILEHRRHDQLKLDI